MTQPKPPSPPSVRRAQPRTWLCLAALVVACGGGDPRDRGHDAGPQSPDEELLGGRGSNPRDASTTDASRGVAQAPDGGTDGAAAEADASFDRLEDTGLEALDVPECLADLFVDPESLRELVSDLSGATEVVIDGESVRIDERTSTEGRARARAYLRDRYLALGYEVTEHVYATGANLVAERAGDDEAFFVVSAHLDAVPGSPGADDDASGLATGFAVAAALEDCDLAHTLRLVAFDEEERGIVGSLAYATSVYTNGADRVLGMIQLEMTGYDSDHDGAYLLVHCDMPGDLAIANTVIAAVGTLELPLGHRRFCTGASDHQAFWLYGFPAIAMGEFFFSFEDQSPGDPNPCYHASCDTADALDYEYMADLTTATALAVATLVGAR